MNSHALSSAAAGRAAAPAIGNPSRECRRGVQNFAKIDDAAPTLTALRYIYQRLHQRHRRSALSLLTTDVSKNYERYKGDCAFHANALASKSQNKLLKARLTHMLEGQGDLFAEEEPSGKPARPRGIEDVGVRRADLGDDEMAAVLEPRIARRAVRSLTPNSSARTSSGQTRALRWSQCSAMKV